MKDIEKEIIQKLDIPVVSYKKYGRPKARLFGFISLAWILISFLPLSMAWGTALDKNLYWLLFLLIPHPIFISLAIYFILTEKPREFEEHHINQKDEKIFF